MSKPDPQSLPARLEDALKSLVWLTMAAAPQIGTEEAAAASASPAVLLEDLAVLAGLSRRRALQIVCSAKVGAVRSLMERGARKGMVTPAELADCDQRLAAIRADIERRIAEAR